MSTITTQSTPELAALKNVCRAIGVAALQHADQPVDAATGTPTGALAVFTSSAVPQCRLEHYAEYIAKSVHQKEAVLLGAVLLLRVWRTGGAAPTPKTVHRLLLGCVSVAMKAHYDDFYVTKYMARIGSVTARELGMLESRVTELVDWSVQISHRELVRVAEEVGPLGQRVTGVASADASVARLLGHFVDGLPQSERLDRLLFAMEVPLPRFAQLQATPIGRAEPSGSMRTYCEEDGREGSSAYIACAAHSTLSVA